MEKSGAIRTRLFPDNSGAVSVVVAVVLRPIAGPLGTLWLRVQKFVQVAFQNGLVRSPLLNNLDGGHI